MFDLCLKYLAAAVKFIAHSGPVQVARKVLSPLEPESDRPPPEGHYLKERYGMDEKPSLWNERVLYHFHNGPEMRDADDEAFSRAFEEAAAADHPPAEGYMCSRIGARHEPDYIPTPDEQRILDWLAGQIDEAMEITSDPNRQAKGYKDEDVEHIPLRVDLVEDLIQRVNLGEHRL